MIIPRAEQLLERATNALVPRSYNNCYYNSRNQYTCRSSSWSRFGRWVLVGILILFALFCVLVLLCCMRRRRTRRARMGTTNTPMTSQPPPQQDYYGGQQEYAPPAGAPPNHAGGYNGGYDYSGQQSGVAQPQNAYYPPK